MQWLRPVKLMAVLRNVSVVSMPCLKLLEDRQASYRENGLPAASISRFGTSLPGPVCMEQLGSTVDTTLAEAKALLGGSCPACDCQQAGQDRITPSSIRR